jgi:hypothetical protein
MAITSAAVLPPDRAGLPGGQHPGGDLADARLGIGCVGGALIAVSGRQPISRGLATGLAEAG